MDRRFVSLFLIVFIDLVGFGIVIPILVLHAEESFGASDLQATGLLTAYSLGLFLAAPLLGRLSDAFGRRPVLIISQLGTLIGFLVMGFANSLFLLYLGRIIDGVSGGNITTARAYINDITTEENRARGFGLISAAFGAGFIVGPALGGAVVNLVARIPSLAAYSQSAPFFVAALFSLGSILGTIYVLPETLSPEQRNPMGQRKREVPGEAKLGDILREPGVRLVLSFAGMTFLAFAIFQSSFPLIAQRNIFPDLPLERVQGSIALYLTLVGVLNVTMQFLFVGPLVKRFGERKLVVFAAFIRIGAFLGVALARTPLALALAFVPMALGNAVSQPSLQSIISRFAPPSMRGRVLGVFQSVTSLTLVVGPIVAGLLLEMTFASLAPQMATAVPDFLAAGLVAIACLLGFQILSLPLPSQEKPMAQAGAAPAH